MEGIIAWVAGLGAIAVVIGFLVKPIISTICSSINNYNEKLKQEIAKIKDDRIKTIIEDLMRTAEGLFVSGNDKEAWVICQVQNLPDWIISDRDIERIIKAIWSKIGSELKEHRAPDTGPVPIFSKN